MTEEYQYLDLLTNILKEGHTREDRTGVGTLGIFSANMEFSLEDQFILLTTKKMFFRGIFEELKLFLSGNTNTKILEEKGVNIWKGNTSRAFLDKRGLTYLPEGDLGCSYSHQWRNFGGEHPLIPETKGLKGFDQIKNIIHLLKTDPMNRRIYLIGSNPAQEHLMSLPPCHNYSQFYVDAKTNKLNCYLSIRSNDIFLGLPTNLIQYNLLTIYLAKIMGLTPGKLYYTACDVHLYSNHLAQAREQITRFPRPFPKLVIKKELNSLEDILNLEFTDLELKDYNPYPAIKAEMAI